VTARVVPDDAEGREAAIAVLRDGGLVALPTDTVYGIAVALDAPGGIERLFQAKGRPVDRAIMLLLDSASQAADLGEMSPAAEALAAACWPGGLTLVLRQLPGADLPEALTGGVPTIGLRVPDHGTPRALAAALGPLPVTSANVTGVTEARDAAEILAQLGDAVDLILDGGHAHGGRASTVVDCTAERPTIRRLGAIPLERIVSVLDASGVEHDLG
jgi:L-threonylcarbamoyladenylate synthase